MKELEKVAKEAYRILKKQAICTYMIGDVREKGYVLPLGMKSMQKFIDAGFKLKEIIIKNSIIADHQIIGKREKENF